MRHPLRYRIFKYCLFGLIPLFIFSLGKNHAHAAVTTPTYSIIDVMETLNKARESRDLATLSLDPALTLAAMQKALNMVEDDYFGHTSPDGTKYWQFMTSAGYFYRNAGENLAFRYKSPSSLVRAWLTSSGHRANILNAKYTDVGIGMAYGERKGSKGWYVVALFGSELTPATPSLLSLR